MNHLSVKLRLLSSPHHSAITELIALAIGSPTPEKVHQILDAYDEPNHYLLGCYNEDKFVGLIGLQTKETHGIIKHVAVLKTYRNQGIGKALIIEAMSYLKLKTCEAETDEEGKGFYEKCNFECNSFKGQYSVRYQCKWKRSSSSVS